MRGLQRLSCDLLNMIALIHSADIVGRLGWMLMDVAPDIWNKGVTKSSVFGDSYFLKTSVLESSYFQINPSIVSNPQLWT